jgi:hypothetical protein
MAMDTLGLQLRTLRYLPDNQTYVGLINTVRELHAQRYNFEHHNI